MTQLLFYPKCFRSTRELLCGNTKTAKRVTACHALSLTVTLLLFFLLYPHPAFAENQTTVIYPELSSPYKDVFDTILSGIAENSTNEIEAYPLAKDFQLSDLEQSLKERKPKGIISLGRRGYLAVKQLEPNIPAVVGALSIVPNGVSGISLSADPEQLFDRLKTLVPNCNRIFVVYSPQNSGWFIPLAEQAAQQRDLLLLSYPANDLREAMLQYRKLLEESKNDSDAIWLPLDKVTVNDDVVLPLLLKKAWDKNLAIISNKPAHAKRGALLAMYPDNYGLGTELAQLLSQITEEPLQPQVIPLRQLNLAVNLRTAAHLGLNFSLQQQEEFTLTFPSR